jgi:hypothetical protein
LQIVISVGAAIQAVFLYYILFFDVVDAFYAILVRLKLILITLRAKVAIVAKGINSLTTAPQSQ